MIEVKINQFPEFFKIADIELREDKPFENKWVPVKCFVNGHGETLSLPKKITKDNVTRTYAIVYDGCIQKEGSSEDKGGMEHTFNIYMTGGLAGKASARSIGVYMDIHKALLAGKKVEIYMHYLPKVKMEFKNAAGKTITRDVRIASKELEDEDLKAYKEVAGEYPRLNMQEAREQWPESVMLLESHLKGGKEVRNKSYINEILNKEFGQ